MCEVTLPSLWSYCYWPFLHVCSLSLLIVNPAQVACEEEEGVRCGDVCTVQCARGGKTQKKRRKFHPRVLVWSCLLFSYNITVSIFETTMLFHLSLYPQSTFTFHNRHYTAHYEQPSLCEWSSHQHHHHHDQGGKEQIGGWFKCMQLGARSKTPAASTNDLASCVVLSSSDFHFYQTQVWSLPGLVTH